MGRPSRPYKTFHISVPVGDEEIMEWLSKQYNQSSSVRELIRLASREIGMVDLFIGSPAQRTPGVRGRARQPILPVDPSVLAPYRPATSERSETNEDKRMISPSPRENPVGDRTGFQSSANAQSHSGCAPASGGIRIDPSVLGEASGRRDSYDSSTASGNSDSGTDRASSTDDNDRQSVIKSLQDMMDS